ncbi:VCBS repeat-containing protein [Streptomyces sp. NPDC091292]|uniref:VCBS repeat-containing protein n=1 Tax=Streptomyces sp. NPDC091292 TaxID=3365991 RepID=UPI00381B98B5
MATGIGSLLLATAGMLSVGVPEASAAACTAGAESDFNGDGIRDTAVADPQATVAGQASAGLVRVILGGGKGVTEISQSLTGMSASPEAGDQFGYSIAVYDADQDGCADLVAGTPYEDVVVGTENQVDAGAVYVVHGSPTGIGEGSVIEHFTQRQLDAATVTEATDLFGFALAAGNTSGGKPYLVVGAPGEAVGAVEDAGCFTYAQGTSVGSVNQDDVGVPGAPETNDRFGASLAATSRYVAVGTPGEAIGVETFAGGVLLFQHTLTDSRPTYLVGANEDHAALTSGTAEKDDRFGTALSLLPYRPSGASSETDALLAVGTPNEDVGNVADAGAVTVVRVTPSGDLSEVNLIDRLSPNVEGDPVVGDFFGQRVALAHTQPGAVGTAATVKLAVGVPNQEVGPAENAGAVHVLPGLGAPGTGDRILTRGDGLLPDTAEARDFTGLGLWATATDLYVGVPYSKSAGAQKGVVYAAPWSVVGGGAGTVRTLRPGADGVPDEGKAFGSSIR